MKTNYWILFLFITSAVFFAACEDEGTEDGGGDNPPVLELSKKLLEMPGTEADSVITVQSNVAWKATWSEEWIDVQPNEGNGDATVTVCNTKTPDLCEFTKDADIIIVATGRPGTLDASMCRDDAVIIDVGVNRISDPSREKGYRLVGDVDYKSFENTSCMVTPVPGGVGLMTVMMLMENTYLAAERRAR